MKKRLLTILLNTLLLVGGVLNLNAQVTIGADEAPVKNAILQIKDLKDSQLGGVTATTGGLLLPRVELIKSKELLPFVDNSVLGTSDYETVQKLAHIGLMVYNLKEVRNEDLSVGVNMWDGEKWVTLEKKLGIANGYVGSCDSVAFSGQYLSKTPLTSGNYMTIPMHITKAGSYTITATATPDNGYYFTSSGVILSPGYYFLTIPGAGSPIKATPTNGLGDNIKITFNGVDVPCPKVLPIEDSSVKPNYRMDCGATSLKGIYKIDKVLDPQSNYIAMTLNVDPSGLGATYNIQTNTVDGIYFKGQGVLNTTSQTIQLQGYGTPTSTTPKVMTITSNSATTVATCSATVIITIPKKKVLALGAGIYNIANTSSGGNVLLRNTKAFGTLPNSIVASEGFEYIEGSSTPTTTTLQGLLNQNPDIIVMGFDLYIPNDQAKLFATYLAKGGVILAFNEGNGNAAQNLARAVFNDQSITQSRINNRGAVYELPITDDGILNGPFMDLRGSIWGEDASTTAGLSNLPTGAIDVYSTGYSISNRTANSGTVTAFKHKTLNFLFVGDGGFISYPGGNSTDTGAYPFRLDQTSLLPSPRSSWGEGGYNASGAGPGALNGSYTVYNSYFFANAMAWAIRQAELSGINTIKK